jgi:4-hydroxy-tetrahydrodipicolinate synthase
MPPITIRGVIASLLTPFDERGSIDWELLATQAVRAESAGVHAMCIGGFASELAGSTPKEFGRVCQTVRGAVRIPLVANIYPDSTPEAIELANAAAQAGASVLLVAQPHYLFQPGAEAFADMLQELKRRVALPLMLSNTVQSATLSAADLRRMVERAVIDGIVQGGNDAHTLADLLCLSSRPPVYSAIDGLAYLAYLLGAEGTLSSLAAVFPAEAVSLYLAHQAGDHERARRMHNRLLRIWRALDHPAELPARLKLGASLCANPAGVARAPYQLAADSGQAVRQALLREGLIAE